MVELDNFYQLTQEFPEDYPSLSSIYFPNLVCPFRKSHLDISLLRMVREQEKKRADAQKSKLPDPNVGGAEGQAFQTPFRAR